MVSYILRHTVQEFCIRIYKNAQIFKKKKKICMTFLLSVQWLIALKSNMEIKGKLRTKLPCSFCSQGVTFLDRLTHTYNH